MRTVSRTFYKDQGIIANWSDLAPEDDELLVQQGLLLT